MVSRTYQGQRYTVKDNNFIWSISMDKDYLWNTQPFSNLPAHPARAGLAPEQIFSEEWAKFCAESHSDLDPPNFVLGSILGSCEHRLKQRDATIAASIITWLGTNIGRHYLEQSETFARSMYKPHAYLASWVIENVRQSHVNSGYRLLEHCLAVNGPKAVRLTAGDLSVAESIALWLGGEEGQAFLAGCEKKIARQAQEDSFRHHLSANLRLDPGAVNHVMQMAASYEPKASA